MENKKDENGKDLTYWGGMENKPAVQSTKPFYMKNREEIIKSGTPKSRPEIAGWEITINENKVEMATLNRDKLVDTLKYIEQLELENKELKKENGKEAIAFATWYSGMDQEKVVKAYNRWISETYFKELEGK
jgi:hypothetical protein